VTCGDPASTVRMVTTDRGTPVGGWTAALLAVRFLTELALVAGLAWLGAHLGGVVLAIAVVVVIVAFWGLLMAPRAERRLADPGRLVVEIVLFGGTAAGLIAIHHPVPAVISGVIAIAAAIAARRFAPEQ
jgi:Protein of unknown function (DUF2568)